MKRKRQLKRRMPNHRDKLIIFKKKKMIELLFLTKNNEFLFAYFHLINA
jgi:hypothetical protein